MPATPQNEKNLVLLGNGYPAAVKKQLTAVVEELDYDLLPVSIGSFKSSERFCELYPKQQDLYEQNKEDIAGSRVHVVMNMSSDMNRTFVDAINCAATLKYYGAKTVHLILPFAPYARQDRPLDKRMVSVMAQTFPRQLKCAGVDQVTTFDMHSKAAEEPYLQTFGKENVQFLSAVSLIGQAVVARRTNDRPIKCGGADGGNKPDDMAQYNARQITSDIFPDAEQLKDHMFFITKAHSGVNDTHVMNFEGDVQDCSTLQFDDMTDTGGTLKNGANTLKEHGACDNSSAISHGIFSGNSLQVLTAAEIDGKPNPIDRLFTTDSIITIHRKMKKLPVEQQERLHIVSTVPLIKQALSLKM